MSTPRKKSPYEFNFLQENLPTPEGQRLFAQEMAIMAATAAIAKAIAEAGISKAELAERIGKSPSFVSQVLGGSRNMTMRTLADFLWACERQVAEIQAERLGQNTVPCDMIDEWLDGESRRRMHVEGLATTTKEMRFDIVASSKIRTTAGAVA